LTDAKPPLTPYQELISIAIPFVIDIFVILKSWYNTFLFLEREQFVEQVLVRFTSGSK
jgi:hypothetical protein